ncbi:MAG: pilus assembly PilX N-terminal domain-containing protein [Vicinamibacterales bacterium]
MRLRLDGEKGTALFIALMATMLLSALGLGLVLTTTTEVLIVGNYRNAQEGLYAADAALERVLPELGAARDWDPILRGEVRSAFVDGASSGARLLGDGSTLDLIEATNKANCGKATTCSIAEMNASTDDRPWGANNPHWRLFAHSRVDALLSNGMVRSPVYVVVWVADDSAENDGDPAKDGSTQSNPGRGMVAVRAAAYGPKGTHKVIEATLGLTDTTQLERGYIAQRGQDELNRRSGGASVQATGRGLTHEEMDLAVGGFGQRGR